jgi:hypothetical protein
MFGSIFGFIAASPDDHRLPVETSVVGWGKQPVHPIMYHTGDKRFASAVPYASIIVELDNASGALLAGNLLDAPYTEAKVGRRVEVVFEKLNDDITLPQFRLAPPPFPPPRAGEGRVGAEGGEATCGRTDAKWPSAAWAFPRSRARRRSRSRLMR